MAATIRFRSGTEVKILSEGDGDGIYECENESLKALLRLAAYSMPNEYYGDFESFARALAKHVGAELVQIDGGFTDYSKWKPQPGMMY